MICLIQRDDQIDHYDVLTGSNEIKNDISELKPISSFYHNRLEVVPLNGRSLSWCDVTTVWHCKNIEMPIAKHAATACLCLG